MKITFAFIRLLGKALFTGLVLVIVAAVTSQRRHQTKDDQNFHTRHLLATTANTPVTATIRFTPLGRSSNCTARASHQFPDDFATLTEKRHGWIVVHVFISFYAFGALAIVCHSYFISSLEVLCQRCNIAQDIAGATFMAVGTSAPELATAIIGVFVTKTNVGLDTVAGSTVFNLFFITAICCLFATSKLKIKKWPVARDSFAFIIAALTLFLVVVDGIVTWYESLITLLVYGLYIVLMSFSSRLERYIENRRTRKIIGKTFHRSLYEDEYDETSFLLGSSDTEVKTYTVDQQQIIIVPEQFDNSIDKSVLIVHEYSGGVTPQREGVAEITEEPESAATSDGNSGELETLSRVVTSEVGATRAGAAAATNGGKHAVSASSTTEESKLDSMSDLLSEGDSLEYRSPVAPPSGLVERIIWLIFLPVHVTYYLTIPDCKRPGCWSRLYPLTFTAAMLWIAGISYVLVWMIEIIGETFSIPESVMGITFLAIGTSLPDAVSSLLATRMGYGDMAVSNIIGSNVFDLLCSGLPWLISTAIVDPNSVIPVAGGSLLFTLISLFVTSLVTIVGFVIFKWKMTVKLGIYNLICYLLFVMFALLYQFNFFGIVNLPLCPS
ncbi:sodium/potassium/calcium exchanger 5-like [Tubulanus polymorphus]|uniref:sodium/potassium/calcium exchanger 5-like n=1 Tax=Tubulanus polymorphus TaxID=672921 RepID=UPI003DA40B64